MRMRTIILLGACFLPIAVSSGQITGTGGIYYGLNLPPTCSRGDVFSSLTLGVMAQCTAKDTWTTIEGGVAPPFPISDVTGLQAAIDAKQATLVSGTNIKTVNGNSVLGSGDVSISGTAAWGSVTGTLSTQTDLQTALDAKQTAGDPVTIGDATCVWNAGAIQCDKEIRLVGPGDVVFGRNGTSGADRVLATDVVGDAFNRASLNIDGELRLGDGTNDLDLLLYRSAAGELTVHKITGGDSAVVAGEFRGIGANLTGLTKSQVGLGNVDNTADSAKSVSSAATLTTPRTINGVSFNGSANITVTAAGSTLSDNVPVTKLNSGTGATSSTYWRGDGTWATPAGGGGTPGYTLSVQALTSSPADGATIYFGQLPKAPVTTAGISRVYIRKAGAIKIANVFSYSGTAGTAENWTCNVRLNNTTDTAIATVGAATNERTWSNTGLNIAVVVGDYVEIKCVNPTWVTNPLTCILSGYLYIE